MFNKSDLKRDELMLKRKGRRLGYDWWWHSFTGYNSETNEPRQFFIEFFLINPQLGKDYPILGQAPESKKNNLKPSYLMVKVGSWGEDSVELNSFFGINAVEINGRAPFSIKAGSCYLDETKSYGSVSVSEEEANKEEYMTNSGTMSWSLEIEKKIAFNVGYGASAIFRKLNAFEMFWHAEGMKSYFNGEVTLNGTKYIVNRDTSYGYSDKNWGKDFTSPWVWLSSNNLVSTVTNKRLQNSVFDIGGGRPKVGPIALNRKLLSAFYYEGKCYEFNFSKLWTFTRTKFNCREEEDEIIWHIRQKTWFNEMICDIKCKKKDMILINYEAPNGTKRHNRLWNGGNGVGNIRLYHKGSLIDDIRCTNVGCEYGEYDK